MNFEEDGGPGLPELHWGYLGYVYFWSLSASSHVKRAGLKPTAAVL